MSTLSSESNREIVSYSLSNIAADVELYVSKKIYHVHSFILRQFSSFFEASLSSKWWKDENTNNDGSSIKYRYHLVPDESGDYIFEPFAPGSKSIVNSSPSVQLVQAYDNLLRVFYIRQFKWDNPNSCTCTMLHLWQSLIDLTDLYGCLATSASRIEGEIISMNKLHTDISADPNGYLWIAKKIRSKRLYHDAFVHIVGQWDTIREEDNITLSDEELLRVYSEYTRINQIGRKLDLKFLEMMSSPDPSNATLKNREIFTSFSHYRTDRSRAFYKSLSQATPARTQEEMWDWRPDARILARRNLACPVLLGETIKHLTCAKLMDDEYPWDDSDKW